MNAKAWHGTAAVVLGWSLVQAAPGATPTARELTRLAEDAATTGQWTPLTSRLDAFWLPASSAPETPAARLTRWRAALARPPGSTALAQAMLFQTVGGPTLSRMAETEEGQAFLRWLLARPDGIEDFLEALQPEDRVSDAIDLWLRLWTADPEGREAFARLAMAVSLVFDEPLSAILELGGDPIDPVARYRWFRAAADASLLRYDLRILPVSELVWVVDARVPESELDWAVRQVRLSPSAWHLAHGRVPFDEGRTRGQAPRAPDSTLASLQRFGGTRVQQAHFAAVAAKANGIPAMSIVESGQGSGFAWFGYKATAVSWNFQGGRTPDDRRAAGTTIDPQTRREVREQEIALLADPQRRTSAFRMASRWVMLAMRMRVLGRPEDAEAALTEALTLADRHPQAWARRLQWMEDDHATAEVWAKALGEIRTAFRRYPDTVALAEARSARSADMARAPGLRDDLGRIRRDVSRGESPRTDLALQNLDREVARLAAEGKADDIRRLYQEHLRTLGADVAAFRVLAPKYYAFAQAEGFAREAVREIDRVFTRSYPVSGSEPSAMRTRVDLVRLVAGLYRDVGDTARADALDRQAAQIERRF